MSSVEVKEQVNRICRLARSFKEIKALCNSATIGAMEINTALQSARIATNPTSLILIDFEEIDRMQKENEEMKELISDYHRGVELLMEAYRNRVMCDEKDKISSPVVESYDPKLLDTIVNQSNQICVMHDLMQKAAAIEDGAENSILEQISFLRKENAVLIELYEISIHYGSADMSVGANKLHFEDKVSQTDEQTDKVECGDIDNNEDDDDDEDDDGDEDGDDDVITVISFKMDESDDDDDEEKEILKCPSQENTSEKKECVSL